MSVELSNKIFNEFVKYYLKNIKSYIKDISHDDVVEYLMSAKIYNITDYHRNKIARISQEFERERVDGKLSYNYMFTSAFGGRPTKLTHSMLTPEVSWVIEDGGWLGIDHPVFVIVAVNNDTKSIKKGAGIAEFILVLPFSDRAVIIHGLVMKNFDMADVLAVQVEHDEFGRGMRLSPKLSPAMIPDLNSPAEDEIEHNKYTYLLRVANSIGSVLDVFNCLENQEKQMFNCYSEKPEGNKYIHMRNPKTKEVSKYPFKSLFIILRNDNELSKKVQRITNSGRKIEYSFSWIVRGHWRNLHNPESIGKGISGEDVVGKTYIHSYLKGDKDAPLLKKETVVLDRRTHA